MHTRCRSLLWSVLALLATLPLPALEPATADAVARACLGADGEFTATGSTTARIACAPHTTFAGLPVLHVRHCERAGPLWTCSAPVLAARETFGRRSVLVTPQGMSFEAAAAITRVVREHPYTFNGRNLAQLLQGWCTVADLGRGAFAGARDYRVRCGGRGVVITRACAQGACRLFPARWDDETSASAAPTPQGAGDRR